MQHLRVAHLAHYVLRKLNARAQYMVVAATAKFTEQALPYSEPRSARGALG